MGFESGPASRRALVIALAVVTLATRASVALADPTEDQKQAARGLMRQGYLRRNTRDFAGALASFRAADEIMHVPTTTFELGRAQVDRGLLVEAKQTLAAAARSPELPGDTQAFKDAREYARQLAIELGDRIPSIRVRVDGVPSGSIRSVRVDGIALPPASLGSAIPVDPGRHAVEAKAGEGTASITATQEVDIVERESRDIVFVLRAPAPLPPVIRIRTAPERPIQHEHAAALDYLVWIGFGAAAAGVAIGSIAGLMSIGDKNSVIGLCHDNRCPPSTYGELDSASSLATTSDVAFVIAGAGAAVGLVSLLMRERAAEPRPLRSGEVTPWLGPLSGGVRAWF